MKLYELSQEYEKIAESLLDGELNEEAEILLAALDGELKDKAEAICCLVQRFNREADMVNAEGERLLLLAAHRYSAATRLKSYLFHHLQKLGCTQLETQKFRLRVQKNSQPTVTWTLDANEIPELYLKPVKPSINAVLALIHWKAGISLPAGFSITHGTHLRIS